MIYNTLIIFVFSSLVLPIWTCPTQKYDLISIQRCDPDIHKNTTYGFFNNIYGSIIYEENLNNERFCLGNCSAFNPTERPIGMFDNIQDCFGTIHECLRISNWETICQGCACLCERSNDPKLNTETDELLDSFCLDPISVDYGYAATGVRFKKRGNRIQIELQQGYLKNGTIDQKTVSWKWIKDCENSKKVVDNFNGWSYDGLKVILEDNILPDGAVVTGVTFNESLKGRYIDHNGNIDRYSPEFSQQSQCFKRTLDLVHEGSNLRPPTAFNGKMKQLSESCKHHVLFGGTSLISDRINHIVPFIDLQEVTTNPSQPISGIGWFYRGQPEYGGYLSLRIFVKKKNLDENTDEADNSVLEIYHTSYWIA